MNRAKLLITLMLSITVTEPLAAANYRQKATDFLDKLAQNEDVKDRRGDLVFPTEKRLAIVAAKWRASQWTARATLAGTALYALRTIAGKVLGKSMKVLFPWYHTVGAASCLGGFGASLWYSMRFMKKDGALKEEINRAVRDEKFRKEQVTFYMDACCRIAHKFYVATKRVDQKLHDQEQVLHDLTAFDALLKYTENDSENRFKCYKMIEKLEGYTYCIYNDNKQLCIDPRISDLYDKIDQEIYKAVSEEHHTNVWEKLKDKIEFQD